MRVIDLINVASEHLKNRGFENPRLEVECMLGNVLSLSRIELYMEFERQLTNLERDNFRNFYRRRLAHEPLQHIIGTSHFRELKIKTDRRALIPRSETEILVEIAVDFLKNCEAPLVADIGTGSGVIALSIAFEIPWSHIVAVDISDEALSLAEENAHIMGIEERITFVSGNMLESLKGRGAFDTIISNPPYVKSESIKNLSPEVKDFDPEIALDGGYNGFRFLSEIAGGAHQYLKSGGLILLECEDDQALQVKKIIDGTNIYSGVKIIKDLAGTNRVVKAQKR